VFTLGIWVCVAIASTITGLDAAQGGVWVVRRLEGGLCGLSAAVGGREVCLLFSQLLAIAANDDARIEGQQEEDHKGNEESRLVGRKGAGASGADLLSGLSDFFVALNVLGGALNDGGSGGALGHTFADESVLEWLVEERNREGDEVRERHEELEPEEDGECADEASGANERSDETSQ